MSRGRQTGGDQPPTSPLSNAERQARWRAWRRVQQGAPVANQRLGKAALAGRLAPFKIPKRIIFTDTLPRNPSGKLLKRELRLTYAVANA